MIMERVRLNDWGRDLVRRAFPRYRGRTYYYCNSMPHRLDSYWVNGYRSYWAIFTKGVFRSVPSNHPVFEKDRPRDFDYPEDSTIVLEHCYAGTRQYIVLHARPETIRKYLAAPLKEGK